MMTVVVLLGIILAIFLLLVTIFWASQLLDLMRQKDDAFPGRWDKLVWVGILLFIPLIGAVLYSIRKPREHAGDGAPETMRNWMEEIDERGRPLPE